MRIIAGKFGGRTIDSPRGHRTHPMSDKMRGALFNALGEIDGLSILDAFAGSGALGLEALSRGAEKVVLIDTDRAAQRAIEANVRALGLTRQAKLIKATAQAWLSTTDERFDIVLCDPPYDDVKPDVLAKLADRTKPGGLAVFSLPPDTRFSLRDEYTLLARKNYGDAELHFYRRQLES